MKNQCTITVEFECNNQFSCKYRIEDELKISCIHRTIAGYCNCFSAQEEEFFSYAKVMEFKQDD